MKVLVIGGVAAGMSAAAKIKRDNPNYEVIVLEKGYEVSYGACGLPYYISDVNPEEDLLVARTAEAFIKSGIDLRLGNEVVKLSPFQRELEVETDQGKIYTESYDRLVIATGASPVRPGFKGIDLDNIMTLSTIADANRIKKAAKSEDIKNVVIVGGGPIGMELVESFHILGKNITVLEMQDHILNTFDSEISSKVEENLKSQGVDIRTSEALDSLEGEGKVEKVITSKGEIDADLVILALGVRPNTEFLKGTGLKMLGNGALLVNKKMETSIDGIYAGGDCASVYHKLLEEDTYIALGTNANKQGRVIALNIGGEDAEFSSSLGTSMLKINDMELAATGLTEKQAKDNNINYSTNIIVARTIPKYYPGGEDLMIKLIYNKDTKVVLGAQLFGDTAALRMNALAVAIHNEMKLEDIAMLDLGYAPPFSRTWDPIHIAAQTAK